MDDKIHNMVAKNIEPSKIEIERQGKVRKNSDGYLISVLNQLFQSIPCQDPDLDIGILADVRSIIEVEGDIERIGIGRQCHPQNQAKSNKVPNGEEWRVPTPLRRNCLLLIWCLSLGRFRHVRSSSHSVFEGNLINISPRSARFQSGSSRDG